MLSTNSSLPPSPLRLVLPTYAQSHDSPFPDYCIVSTLPSSRPKASVSPPSTSVASRSKDHSSSRCSRSRSHCLCARSSSSHSRRPSSSSNRHSSRQVSPSHRARRAETSVPAGPSPLRAPDIDDRVNRTLHIGRLCSNVRKEELRSLFESLGGDVLNVYIKPPLPTGQPTFAFVKFSNLIDAYHAKNKFHLYKLGSTRILTGYGRINATNRVWLGNMDRRTNCFSLYRELDRIGTIVKLAHYKSSGEAVVQFETVAGAESARDMLRGHPSTDLLDSRKDRSHKSSRDDASSSTCPCVHGNSSESCQCKSCHGKKSKSRIDCDLVTLMSNESGVLQVSTLTTIQVQVHHPTLWHRSKILDRASPSCLASNHATFAFEKLADDEDFTKVKRGTIVTDFVDDSPRHMIEFEASDSL